MNNRIKPSINLMSFGLNDLLVFFLAGGILLAVASAESTNARVMSTLLTAAAASVLATIQNSKAKRLRMFYSMFVGVVAYSVGLMFLIAIVGGELQSVTPIFSVIVAGVFAMFGLLAMLSAIHFDD